MASSIGLCSNCDVHAFCFPHWSNGLPVCRMCDAVGREQMLNASVFVFNQYLCGMPENIHCAHSRNGLLKAMRNLVELCVWYDQNQHYWEQYEHAARSCFTRMHAHGSNAVTPEMLQMFMSNSMQARQPALDPDRVDAEFIESVMADEKVDSDSTVSQPATKRSLEVPSAPKRPKRHCRSKRVAASQGTS